MANFPSPFRRLISTDGSLVSAQTQVGDALYNQFTFVLSFRTQDALGAPVEVAVPSIGGGGGTSNRIVKFWGSGSMDDSNATDNGATFTIGNAGQWRMVGNYAGGTGFQWVDNANNLLFEVGGTGKCTSTSDFTVTNGVLLLPGAAPVAQTVLTISPVSGLVSVAADATTTPYTAGIPGNWAGAAPTNVEAAIDRMAALLQVLNGGLPIP